MTNLREQRGFAIAATCTLKKEGKYWHVPSQSGNGKRYLVNPMRHAPTRGTSHTGFQTNPPSHISRSRTDCRHHRRQIHTLNGRCQSLCNGSVASQFACPQHSRQIDLDSIG